MIITIKTNRRVLITETRCNKSEPLLWLSDARGVFIPRDFAASFADRSKAVSGVSEEDWSVLDAGPDGVEWYWDVWADVCDNAVVTDENGHRYRVHQDGDCWLIPEGMEWNENADWYQWPQEAATIEEG